MTNTPTPKPVYDCWLVEKGRRSWYETDDPALEGVHLGRVTSVLDVIAKPALIPWARKTALEDVRRSLTNAVLHNNGIVLEEDIDTIIANANAKPDAARDEAADYGTRAHAVLQELTNAEINGGRVSIPEDITPVVERWYRWRDEAKLDIFATEVRVYSVPFKIAGTIDFLARDADGQLVIGDYKTGRGLYPEAALQLAAYRLLYAECHQERASRLMAVHLPRERPGDEADWWQVREVAGMEAALARYMAAYRLAQKWEAWQ